MFVIVCMVKTLLSRFSLTDRGLRTATWTPLFWTNPESVLDPEATQEILSLNEWADNEFTWERDPVFGVMDVCRSVEWIVENKRGDCVDYSALALSWLISRDFDDIYLMFCYKLDDFRWRGHLVAGWKGLVYDTSGVQPANIYDDWNTIKKPIDKSEFR